jgi:hypothetical protein
MSLSELPPAWKARAQTLRQWAAADEAATAWEAAARELEAALAESGDRLLDLQAAAAESGYSSDQLGRLVRQGRIPNAGRPHAPRIRMRDPPRKPGFSPTRNGDGNDSHPGKELIARSLVVLGSGERRG